MTFSIIFSSMYSFGWYSLFFALLQIYSTYFALTCSVYLQHREGEWTPTEAAHRQKTYPKSHSINMMLQYSITFILPEKWTHKNCIYFEFQPCLIKWLCRTRVNEKFTCCRGKTGSVAAAWLTMVIWQHKFLPLMIQTIIVHGEQPAVIWISTTS
jgi:hypothetical protein